MAHQLQALMPTPTQMDASTAGPGIARSFGARARPGFCRLQAWFRRQAAPALRRGGRSLRARCTNTKTPGRVLFDRDSEVRVRRPGPQPGWQYLAGLSVAPE